jgi:uncharacterized protein (TIGR02611 family)
MVLQERDGGIRQKAGDVRQRITDYRSRLRSTPAGRVTLRVGTAVVGLAVVAVGIVLIPFPGPGWLIVLTGLAILALEFVWAQRLLAFTRRHLERWWRWVLRQSLVVRGLVAASGMVFVSGVVLVTLWLSFDTTPADLWRMLGGGS